MDKITIEFTESQSRFIRESKRIMQANSPDKQITEVDVIWKLLWAGHQPFLNYLDTLPKRTVKHLKLIK